MTYLSRWKQKDKIEDRKLIIKEKIPRKNSDRLMKGKFDRKSNENQVHVYLSFVRSMNNIR